MRCIRCGVVIADRHPTTHEPEFCSDACENDEVHVDVEDMGVFLNRLRILRSLDAFEVPLLAGNWPEWRKFRDDPSEYLISCPPDEAEHIWTALRKREE